MSILDSVKAVAGFADETSPVIQWSHVVFDKGELWAQGPKGGALVKTPGLNISVAVPAKKLLKALQAVGEESKLEVEKNYRLTIQGEGSTARVEGVKIGDMPTFHRPASDAEWLFVPGLDRVASLDWCVSADETRRHLSGIHFNPDGSVEATNGHAMMRLDLGVRGFPDVIAPAPVLRGLPAEGWLAKAGGKLFIASQKGGTEGFRVANLHEAAFPPAGQIIQGAKDQGQMIVNREAVVKLLKRAKLSNAEVTLAVAQGRLTAEVDGERQQSLFGFVSSVPYRNVEGQKEVPEGRIGFSAALLLPMFGLVTSEEVTVYLSPSETGGLDPLMMIDGPLTGIVMPYRL